jgi:hypothetical protein
MLRRDTEPCAGTIVEDIDRESHEPGRLGEAIDNAGQMIKGVGKVGALGHIRAAKAREVRSHEAKAVGKQRNEIPEHVA